MTKRLERTTTCVKVNLRDLWFLENLLRKTQEDIARQYSFVPQTYEEVPYYQIITRLLDAAQSAYDEAQKKGEYYGIKIEERASEQED